MNIKKIDCPNLMKIFKTNTILLQPSKIEQECKYQIRCNSAFNILKSGVFKSKFVTKVKHLNSYYLNDKINNSTTIIDTESLEIVSLNSNLRVYAQYEDIYGGSYMRGSDYSTWKSILMDQNLDIIAELPISKTFWHDYFAIEKDESIKGETTLHIYDPLTATVLWKRTYKGSATVKDSTDELLFIYIKAGPNTQFQIVNARDGSIKYVHKKVIGNLKIDHINTQIIFRAATKIIIQNYFTFEIINEFLLPAGVDLGLTDVSLDGMVLYSWRGRAFFYLMDRKTGNIIWDHDYESLGIPGRTVRHWVPLDTGNHILSIYDGKSTTVYEFTP